MRNIFIILTVLVIGVGVGYLVSTQRQQQKLIAQLMKEKELMVSPPVASVTPNAEGNPISPTMPSVTLTTETVTPAPSVPVVYIAEGSYSASDKAQLNGRWVEPYIEYNVKGLGRKLASITFEPYAGGGGYAYTFLAIFEGGGSESSLVAKAGGDIEWWIPGCMVACEFTPEFKTKYPEIVSKAN